MEQFLQPRTGLSRGNDLVAEHFCLILEQLLLFIRGQRLAVPHKPVLLGRQCP